jgi:exodeoxyribonuclease VII small subunit
MNPPRSGDAPSGAGRPDGLDENPGNGAASYEHARDELAEVVARLEAGGLSLDESLTLWERGEQLAAICTRFLDGARERVERALASGTADAGGDEAET